MDNRIVIIDGNSLMNRAFFALKTNMSTKDGFPTNGIYGFLNMLTKIGKDYPYTHIAVAFDRKSPTFRHKEYAEYKAGRKPMPDDLSLQFPVLKEILDAMNIKMLEMDGFEADDLIGTLSKIARDEDFESLIITGDKDALQLADDKTKILFTKVGISSFDLYDEAAIIEKYGLTPSQFLDLKGLMGDTSDNIPGVPGIGEKTGIKLLLEYKTLENVLNNTHKLKGKLKENIEENQMLALMSKKLATIHRNVPIGAELKDFEKKEFNYDELRSIYKRLEFKSFLKNFPEEKKDSAEEIIKNKFNITRKERHFKKIENTEELELFLSDLSEIYIKCFSDNNKNDLPFVDGIGIMSSNSVVYLDCSSNRELLFAFIRIICNNKIGIKGHFISDCYYIFLRYIYSDDKLRQSLETKDGHYFNTIGDSAIISYVLNPSMTKYGLSDVFFSIFNEQLDISKLEIESGINLFQDEKDIYFKPLSYFADLIDAIFEYREEEIIKNDLSYVYRQIELNLIEVMASMGAYGISLIPEVLKNIGSALKEKIHFLTEEIHSLAGESFNINSTQQLGIILFEKLGLKAPKKTKTGYSTSAEVLEKIKNKHEIIPLILEYRTLSKINSTYVDGFLPHVGKDGKVHANFLQAVTATGRISCTDPNLQNIPIRQEEGRQVRKAFVPSEGYIFTGADYSQIELRVLAHISEEPHLIEAFNQGVDIHKMTASKVFGVPLNEVSSLQRSNAKAVNFGVIYGMSGFGLSEELNIDIPTATSYIKDYFENNPKVADLMNSLKDNAKNTGYVSTIFGRKRYIPSINSSNFMMRQSGERLAMNTPIQGSAADIIKIAMVKVYQGLLKENMEARLILQIHDELIVEAKEEIVERAKDLLRKSMEEAVKLNIKLEVDIHTAKDWYELK